MTDAVPADDAPGGPGGVPGVAATDKGTRLSVAAASGGGLPNAIERERRGTPVQRIRVRLVAAGAWLVCRLPEGLLLRLADLAGGLVYRTSGPRREQARRNLARVAAWAAEQGRGDPSFRAAATDSTVLESFVRAAFRNHARYWIELLRAPRVTRAYLDERLHVDTPDGVALAFGAPGPGIYIGLHFGVIEATALFLVATGGRPVVAPMQTVGDPELQRWFRETRATIGVRIVGLREARRELVRGLGAGEAVAIVGDRDLTGGGISTELFGHPAPLPVGPALLVLETGAHAHVAAVRRIGLGRYAGRIDRIELPAEGTRRERVEAFLAQSARHFESIVLDAPEQWWAVFYPIWPDLAEPTEAAAAEPEAAA